ncbi:hypothetical protein JXR93_13790 [bacterium]|nr:hypothetical protein [bacterium]
MIRYFLFIFFILLVACQNSNIIKNNSDKEMSFESLTEHYKRNKDIFVDFFEKSYSLKAILYNSKIRDSFSRYKQEKNFNSTIFAFNENLNEDSILISFFSADTKTKYIDHKNSYWSINIENENGDCKVEKIEEIQEKAEMIEIFFKENYFSDFYKIKFLCPKETQKFLKLRFTSLQQNIETLWEFENGSI